MKPPNIKIIQKTDNNVQVANFSVVPNSCKVVEDPVAASGWCQLFAAKSA